MATIAELQIKVDSTETERGTKALLALAEAADKAAAARKRLNDIRGGGGGPGGGGGGGDDSETKRTKSLSEAIDAQERKLAALARQRKALNDSPLRTEDPEKYKRLNEEIDARTELVRRQGNSLDRLAAQAKKEQEQRERAAATAKRLADQEAAAAQRKEEREARMAAAAEKRLTATISSLSQQVKAQEDYNRTISQLNAGRAVNAFSNGRDGGITAAQYDTYVKQAAAIRDAALAQADNSKEIERAQRAYDSSVASLGKVERAQAVYAKNLRDTDAALKLGLITQEQYDTKMNAFAAKRDASITAANNGAAAEARFASQLQSTLSAFDPVIRATDTYKTAVSVLARGLENGKISAAEFNKALTEQRMALDAVKSAQPGSADYQAKQYQASLDRLVPYNAAMRELAAQEKILTEAKRSGKVVTDQQIIDHGRAERAIAAERKELERRNQEERRGNSAKQDAAALRGLPAQFTDIVVSLQGGQAPLTVLLQQGGQVKDMFGGVGNAFKAMGGYLLSIINPITVVATSLASLAYVMHAGAAETTAFNKAMAASSNFSGASLNTFLTLRDTISGVAGTAGLAAEALNAMQRSGKISVEQFEAIGIAAVSMQRATGTAVADTVAEFAALAKDPANAVLNLNEKYKSLTSEVYMQIAALQRVGDTLGATALAQQEMAKGATEMADNIKASLGTLEKSWKFVSNAAKSAWDEMLGLNRDQSVEEQIANTQKQLADRKTGLLGWLNLEGVSENSESTNFLKERLRILQRYQEEQSKAAETTKKLAQADELAIAGQKNADDVMLRNQKQSERLTKELDKLRLGYSNVVTAASMRGLKPTEDQTAQYIANVKSQEKKIAAAIKSENREGGGRSPIDSRDVQEVKSNLNVITSEYDAAYKKITALGAANVVSQEATFASQSALLVSQKEAVVKSYDEQITAIKKLQGVKGNTASQSINLDNQLTRAEDARLKSMQDMDAKMEVLAIAEKGRLQKRAEAIESYSEALQQQIENTKLAGDAAVAAVGSGERQNKLNQDILAANRQFAKEQLSLSKQLSKGMDTKEYEAKLQIMKDAHSDMTAQIIANNENIKEAEGDWKNGATKAFEDYAAEGQNYAKAVYTAITGALDSIGDAMATFVTTGKLNFKELTASILTDMAKIAAKQATNALLSNLIGAGIGMFSGGAGAAGAVSSLGSTSAGYSSSFFPQAKGGGWTGGTQFFAQGGAFTNSIVSSPTAFGMSGGGRGVMGEAGPEAIMPLARASDGSLGVRMVGAGGMQTTGGVNVYVTINSDGSVNAETDKAGTEQFGKEIGTIIESKYRLLLASDLKDGGAIKNAIKAG